MKKAVMVFIVTVFVMSIFPAYGICTSVGGSLVDQINNLIAAGDQSIMESTLEELNAKSQKCSQLANKTDAQSQICEEVSQSILLLEQALDQD